MRIKLFIVVFLLVFLTGCSSMDVLSEEDILQSVKVTFYDMYPIWEYDDFSMSVTDRTKTDEYDCTTVVVNVSNEYFSYSGVYKCYFILDNGKWILEKCTEEGNEIDILSISFSEEEIDEFVTGQVILNGHEGAKITCNLHQPDLENGRFRRVYTVEVEEGYLLKFYSYEFVFFFDMRYGWNEYDSDIKELGSAWNIEGRWTYENSQHSAEVVIHKVSGNTVKVEYNYDLVYQSGERFFNVSGKSNRVEEITIQEGYLKLGEERFYVDQYKGIYMGAIILAIEDNYDLADYSFPISYKLLDRSAVAYTNESLTVWDPIDYCGKRHDDRSLAYSGGKGKRASQTYELYGKYKTVSGTFYLCEYAQLGVDATARIYGDGVLLYECNAHNFTENCCENSFVINVEDVRELTFDMPGESVQYRWSDWGILSTSPIIAASDIIVSKTSCYDAVPFDKTAGDTLDVSMECYSFFYNTGIRPLVTSVEYNEKYFILDSNYDYVLNEETAKDYAEGIYEQYAVDGYDYFVMCYFDDGLASNPRSEYFYIYAPEEFWDAKGTKERFYDIVKQNAMTENDFKNYACEILDKYQRCF